MVAACGREWRFRVILNYSYRVLRGVSLSFGHAETACPLILWKVGKK